MRKLALTVSPVVIALCVAVPAAVGLPSAGAATPTAAVAAVAPTVRTVDSVVLSDFEAALVSGVNNARTAAGVPALRVAGGTTDVARRWAVSLANTTTLAHNANLGAQLDAAGSTGWRVSGENVATGNDAAAVVAAYLNSPPHKANILDRRFTVVGVGAASNNAGRVADVLDFVDIADTRATTTPVGYSPTPPVVVTPTPTPTPTQPPVTTTPAPTPPAVVAPPADFFQYLIQLILQFCRSLGIVIPGM